MLTATQIGALFERVTSERLLDATTVVAPIEKIGREPGHGLRGSAVIAGKRVSIVLTLGRSFPLSLPKFFIEPWDALGFIPHVDEDGYICYASAEGLFVDSSRPFDIIAWAWQRAEKVLLDGATSMNHADFVEEFESYWARGDRGRKYDSVLEPGSDVREILVARDVTGHSIIANDRTELESFAHGIRRKGKYNFESAIFLPLQSGSLIRPPRLDQGMWSAKETRDQILPNLSIDSVSRLEAYTRRPKFNDTVVLSIPRSMGGHTIVAFRAKRMTPTHVLSEGGGAQALVPISVRRLDRGYLVTRAGSVSDLRSKKVLLIGVGAVGGIVATEIAKSGVSQLTFMDYDELSPDNTFRHVLGQQYWDRKKAEAMKESIEAALPYSCASAINAKLQDWLRLNAAELLSFDLVISALGNPTVELELNRVAWNNAGPPACAFVWVEPHGIGGHALLTLRGKPGCLNCLYTTPDGDVRMFNRASFAAPGQSFGRALSGCGSLFTPFAAVDAFRSAEIVVRLAVAHLRGSIEQSTLRSWRGDATVFRSEGFTTSPRYDQEIRESIPEKNFAVARCPVCGRPDSAQTERL